MGKKTSLYSRGNNPIVTPHNSPAEGGTTAPPTVLPWRLEGRGDMDMGGTAAVVGRHYRLRVVLPLYCRCEVPHNPTRKRPLESTR